MNELTPILIGTAGHIDHGKTRLVACLTGVDTDRLPEEKSRGISIDLGFAHFDAGNYRFGVIDVPGHERFVRNMVAGAIGIDVALLVIAADDSVMPQTREHLDIMSLLGLSVGVVAITKCDMVDAEMIELVAAEAEELIEGTFLQGSRIVPVSAVDGTGIDELRRALCDAAGDVHHRISHSYFRMPIDRVFTRPGLGTIVTGSIRSGEVHSGDTLELIPSAFAVRVRNVHHHGHDVDASGAHRRTAVNLSAISTEDVSRGDELATQGFLKPTHRLLVEASCLINSPVPLEHRHQVMLHIGTTETPARVVIPAATAKPESGGSGHPIQRGEKGIVELRTAEPVAGEWGQRFILRVISPVVTIGGGRVLDPDPAEGRLRDPLLHAQRMASDDPRERLACVFGASDEIDSLEAARRCGISADEFTAACEAMRAADQLVLLGGGKAVSAERLDRVGRSMMNVLREELLRQQPRRVIALSQWMSLSSAIARMEMLRAAVERMLRQNIVVKRGDNIGPADAQVKLTKRQQAALDLLLNSHAEAGLAPPTRKELAAILPDLPKDDVDRLLRLSEEDGLLIRLSPDLCFAADAVETAVQALGELFQQHTDGVTLAQMRDQWGVTRKHALPLAEYCDAQQVTVRDGDLRKPGPKLQSAVDGS